MDLGLLQKHYKQCCSVVPHISLKKYILMFFVVFYHYVSACGRSDAFIDSRLFRGITASF